MRLGDEEQMPTCQMEIAGGDPDGFIYVCAAENHSHCAGCDRPMPVTREQRDFRAVYCSADCRRMVEDYDRRAGRDQL